MVNSLKLVSNHYKILEIWMYVQTVKVYKLNSWNLLKSCSTFVFDVFTVRINDTVTFVEDGFDEDIEFGDEISDDDEDDVDNVSI